MFPWQTIKYHSDPSLSKEVEVEWFYENLQDLLELIPKKDVFFIIIGDCNAKVRSQEIPGVTGNFDLGVQKEAGQRLTEFCQRTHWSEHSLTPNNTRDHSTHTDHQMVNTKIRLITFFAAEDGEALYSMHKKEW